MGKKRIRAELPTNAQKQARFKVQKLVALNKIICQLISNLNWRKSWDENQ